MNAFQICSLFGRVRIHGYDLPPLTFHSVHNYRTNGFLPIELIRSSSSTPPSLLSIQSLLSDRRLAEHALNLVQQHGGDIVLLRSEPSTASSFIKAVRAHPNYSYWFSNTRSTFGDIDPWRRLENSLDVRLIETIPEKSVIPSPQFVSTADHVIHRWKNETSENTPFIVLVCGEKDMGKSTLMRYLLHRALNHTGSSFALTYMDCDIGQSEFTISGCISYVDVRSPLLGPPHSHIRSHPKPDRLLYFGYNSAQSSAVRYLQYIDHLRQLWNIDHAGQRDKRSLILINTMGWGTGRHAMQRRQISFEGCRAVV